MIKVGIVGGTGYTGIELIRLLARHPEVEISVITSRAEAGLNVSDLFPNLRGYVSLPFVSPEEAKLSRCDLVFFATPNGVSMHQAEDLISAGVRVIDLAADFRLRDSADWETWYDMTHACPDLLEQAVYGLPELNRNLIKNAQLVANPGCYPTAVALGLLPLLKNKLISPSDLIADAKSGVSGAGRKASVDALLCEVSESFNAYGVNGHRHLPEITQTLQTIAEEKINLTFVPHLTPMIRGIHGTLYGTLTEHGKQADLQSVFEDHYRNEPFVDVLPIGSHPKTSSVKASNYCRIAIHRPQHGDKVVVLSVIDNLVKGAAGQAIQNLNIMFGFAEKLGLDSIAIAQ